MEQVPIIKFIMNDQSVTPHTVTPACQFAKVCTPASGYGLYETRPSRGATLKRKSHITVL